MQFQCKNFGMILWDWGCSRVSAGKAPAAFTEKKMLSGSTELMSNQIQPVDPTRAVENPKKNQVQVHWSLGTEFLSSE